jgi:hypothetical protein
MRTIDPTVDEGLKRQKARQAVERKLQRALALVFRAQCQNFVKELSAPQAQQPSVKTAWWRLPATLASPPAYPIECEWARLFDLVVQQTLALFVSPLQYAARAGVRLGMTNAMSALQINCAFTLANPRIVQYLDRLGYRLAGEINDGTRQAITATVDVACREQWDHERLLKELYRTIIVGNLTQQVDGRAKSIAISVVRNAYEFGCATVRREVQHAVIPASRGGAR